MRVLVTGTAACGKSAFAERRACELDGPVLYLATMRVRGREDERIVQRHRALRAGKGFATVELACACELEEFAVTVPERTTVLLEDLANLVSNTLFDECGRMLNETGACKEIARGLERLGERVGNLIVVGNEIGAGTGAESLHVAAYVDVLGKSACRYAATCDEVFEVVAGIPFRLR